MPVLWYSERLAIQPIRRNPALSVPLFQPGFFNEDTAHDLADAIKGRNAGQLIRQTLRLPRSEARKRAKQLFEEFPSASYLTEIESWQEPGGSGQVEFTFKRLENPIDPD